MDAMSRRVLPVGAAAVVLAGALSGCSFFGGDEGAASPSTTRASTSTTAPPVAVSEPPTVLDAGAEPRQELRTAFTEGQTATVTFTSDLAVDQDTGARAQGVDSPPISQRLIYTVGAVTDAGADLTIEIADITVKAEGTDLTDAETSALQDELAPLIGTTGNGRVTPLGELEDLVFDLPAGTGTALATQLDTLDEQIAALGPALPAEAVGVGARWTTTSTSDAAGARTETVATYTVTSLDDGTLGYTATTTSSAPPQDLAVEGLPKGTTAALQSSELTGTTTGTLALDRPGFTLRTRISGPQVLVLTTAGTDTTVNQQVSLAYSASTSAG